MFSDRSAIQKSLCLSNVILQGIVLFLLSQGEIFSLRTPCSASCKCLELLEVCGLRTWIYILFLRTDLQFSYFFCKWTFQKCSGVDSHQRKDGVFPVPSTWQHLGGTCPCAMGIWRAEHGPGLKDAKTAGSAQSGELQLSFSHIHWNNIPPPEHFHGLPSKMSLKNFVKNVKPAP